MIKIMIPSLRDTYFGRYGLRCLGLRAPLESNDSRTASFRTCSSLTSRLSLLLLIHQTHPVLSSFSSLRDITIYPPFPSISFTSKHNGRSPLQRNPSSCRLHPLKCALLHRGHHLWRTDCNRLHPFVFLFLRPRPPRTVIHHPLCSTVFFGTV
jgi:hypothetical protein